MTLLRSQNEGDVATAFTLARILSNIPLSRGGPTSVVIFDIHALQERFYFGDTGKSLPAHAGVRRFVTPQCWNTLPAPSIS